MKLRLKGNDGNSLRLRISRSEMERLVRGESIVEDVCFAPGADGSFRYALVSEASAAVVALSCTPGSVRVSVPASQVKLWSSEAEVGIYTTITVKGQAPLELVLEKDFACLDRDDADNADTFEHPKAGAVC